LIFKRDTHLAILSRDWAGLIPAALLGAAGGGLAANASPWSLAAGGFLAACALILAAGAAWHLLHIARVKARHPAPGRLVDAGGFRLHVLAEGECNGTPAVIWLPGGHSGGFAMYHLHRILREETRSVLIDRAGTGWSDIGPFPRSTAREAVEVIAALQSAGEKGPFILAGHSWGGLLAANIARRRPDLTAALILLDATPPDTLIYGPRLSNLANTRLLSTWTAIRHLYGLHRDRAQERDRRNPAVAHLIDLITARLGPEGAAARALEASSRGPCAAASIFTELSAEGMARVGWETTVYDGDLGGLPVLLVAPADLVEFASLPATVAAAAQGKAGELEAARMRRVFAHSRERYLATSTASRRIYSPAGTGHNFPYEAPEFVAEVVRSCLK
jgi:pimeloyl-ACP methyl ester carboxylesterase